MATLEYTDAQGILQRKEIPETGSGIVLGRSASSHVVLQSHTVGRNHGKIVFEEGAFVYYDLGSVNGSFVNDRKVTTKIALIDGDVLRCGDIEVRFRGGPSKPLRVPKETERPVSSVANPAVSASVKTSQPALDMRQRPETRPPTGQVPVRPDVGGRPEPARPIPPRPDPGRPVTSAPQRSVPLPAEPAQTPKIVTKSAAVPGAALRPERPSQGKESPGPTPVARPPVSGGHAEDGDREALRLRKENAALRIQTEGAAQRAGAAVSEMSELRKQLAEARTALNEKDDEIRHLAGVLKDAERRIKEAETRASTAATSLESVHTKYMNMRDQVSHLQGLVDQARAEANDAQAEAAELKEKLKQLAEQAESARNRGSQAAEEIANLKVKFTEKDRELERLRRELDLREYDIKNLREENERLQEFCESDTGRQGALERKVRNLEAVIEENRNYIAELRRAHQEKDRELREVRLGVGIVDLEQEKQHLLDDYHKKSREVDELRAKLSNMSAELAGAATDKEALETRIQQLEEAARARKFELEDISDHPEYKAKVREADGLREEVESLNRQIQTMAAELSAARDSALRAAKERSDSGAEEKSRLQAELAASQEKLRSLQSRLDAVMESLPDEPSGPPAAELQAFLEGVSDAMESLQDDLAVLGTTLKDVYRFLMALVRTRAAIPEEAKAMLGETGLSETAETVKGLERVLTADIEALRTAWRSGDRFWKPQS